MSHLCEHYPYIIPHIKECFHVSAYVFDASGVIICPDISGQLINLQFYKDMLHHYLPAKEEENSKNFPQILVFEDNIYFLVFPCEDEAHMVLGPIGSSHAASRQMSEFKEKFHLEAEAGHFPKMSISQLMSMTSVIWFMMTGKSLESHQIHIRKNILHPLSESDAVQYCLYKHREGKKQNTYEGEQIWCNYIETGNIEKMDDMISNAQNIFSSFENVGILAKNNDFKQIEYTLVTSISLAMHAAIRGGVSPLKCYEASDLLLQKVASCNDILKMYDLFIENYQTFTVMVYMHNQEPRYSILIEKCKDYIARHLYHPFKISEMSAELCVNNNYISQLFSRETGMTLQHYIRNERLNAAANLLKYSEESVGQIADYMQFSSPSRFSSYFKSKYHLTPFEYRMQYKIAEFKE